MDNIKALGTQIQPVTTQPQAPATKPEEAVQAPADKVEVSGKEECGCTLKKAAKFGLGVAFSSVLAPLNAVSKGVSGATEAGLKGMDATGEVKGVGDALQRLAVTVSPMIGGLLAAPLGPVSMVAGMLVAPGVTSSLIEGGKGLVQGTKAGVTMAKNLGAKAGEKATEKWGETAGTLAKYTVGIAAGLVTTPLMAFVGGVTGGLNAARKAIGMNPAPDTTGEKLKNVGKELAVTGGFIYGSMTAGAGLVAGAAGGVATAGGIATGVAGVKEGVKGFKQGVDAGFGLAEKLVDKLDGHKPPKPPEA